MSVTRPAVWEKSCVHAGVVFGATRIDPGAILSKSFGDKTTLAGTVTVPELTAKPLSASPDSSFRTWISSACSCKTRDRNAVGVVMNRYVNASLARMSFAISNRIAFACKVSDSKPVRNWPPM